MSLSKETKAAVPAPKKHKTSVYADKNVGESRQCPICHVYYKSGNSYWQHVRYVHARVLIQCVICEKSYKRATLTKQHILHSHKIAWHLCSNYVRKIKNNDWGDGKGRTNGKTRTETKLSSLKYFKKKTLHLISSFNCYDCPGSFPTITALFEHVKSHRNGTRHEEMDQDSENMDSDCEAVDSSFEKGHS